MARRGENIYKRRDGRWEGRYIKGRDINNKAKYGYIYAKTYNEVKFKLSEIRVHPFLQKTLLKNEKTIDYFCILWLNEIVYKVKRSTYVKYFNIIHNHIIPSIGTYTIFSVNPSLIKNFIDDKLINGRLNGLGGLAVKTVRDMISVLKLVFQYAQDLGTECSYNFDAIRIKSQEKKIIALTSREQEQMTAYLMNKTDNTKLGILICLYSGLRIGEICALKFNDISDGIIHVTKTMQRIQRLSDSSEKKTEIIITTPKSTSSIRDVPIPNFLNNIIRKFYISDAYVLTGQSEKYVEPRTLQNRFKTHAQNCGIHGINFHICRHTFATACIEVGVEVKSLSEILGHSSVNITLNRYVHSSMDLKRKNIEKLQKKFICKPSEI